MRMIHISSNIYQQYDFQNFQLSNNSLYLQMHIFVRFIFTELNLLQSRVLSPEIFMLSSIKSLQIFVFHLIFFFFYLFLYMICLAILNIIMYIIIYVCMIYFCFLIKFYYKAKIIVFCVVFF